MIKNLLLVIIFILLTTVGFSAKPVDSITTVTAQIISSSDDAEENVDTAYVNYKSSDLELVDKRNYQQLVGIRFQLDIPKGAKITEGHIKFTAAETDSDKTNLIIHGEYSSESNYFTSEKGNISNRPKTSSSVTWSPEPWESGDSSNTQQTPDLSTIIQEIINQDNWKTGNHIVFLISGNGIRTAKSYDGSKSQSSLLSVSYTNEISSCTDSTCSTQDPTIKTTALYFVDRNHPNASDSNTGNDENFPWKTFVHAAAVVKAGDTVYVKEGIYTDGDVVLEHSGERNKEIVLSAYPGHERKVIIENAGFISIGHSHVVLHGFKFMHTPKYGIRFQGPDDPYAPPAENITISGNHTYDTWSSGISIWGVKWGNDPGDYNNIKDVIIEKNLLELGTNGGKNEIITVANGAVNVDVRYNEIRLGDPSMTGGDEGIDFKEGVRNSRIYGNLIHDLSDKAIYIDGGSGLENPLVTNIEIFNNIMWNLPSAGICITTEGLGDVDGVKVYNNVVYQVDGDGYLVYNHPGGMEAGGTVKNVQFINNTAYKSGNRSSGYGGFRVNHKTATGILFRNNIAWNNNGYDIRGELETSIDHNLCRESLCEVRTDPQFSDSAPYLRLQSTSPAIDYGSSELAPTTDIEGMLRPQGLEVDLGAYEY